MISGSKIIILEKVDVFAGLSRQELDALAEKVVVRSYPKNTVVINEGGVASIGGTNPLFVATAYPHGLWQYIIAVEAADYLPPDDSGTARGIIVDLINEIFRGSPHNILPTLLPKRRRALSIKSLDNKTWISVATVKNFSLFRGLYPRKADAR